MSVTVQVRLDVEPRATDEDCCAGFTYAVKVGIVKEKTHQFLNSKSGDLTRVRYYYMGPKDLRKCVIFEYCPSCGKRVKVNQDFLATPGLFVEEALA